MRIVRRTALLLALLIAACVLLCACNPSLDGEYRCTSYKYVNTENGTEGTESSADMAMVVNGSTATVTQAGEKIDTWSIDQNNKTMTDTQGNTAEYQQDGKTITVTAVLDSYHKVVIVFEKI